MRKLGRGLREGVCEWETGEGNHLIFGGFVRECPRSMKRIERAILNRQGFGRASEVDTRGQDLFHHGSTANFDRAKGQLLCLESKHLTPPRNFPLHVSTSSLARSRTIQHAHRAGMGRALHLRAQESNSFPSAKTVEIHHAPQMPCMQSIKSRFPVQPYAPYDQILISIFGLHVRTRGGRECRLRGLQNILLTKAHRMWNLRVFLIWICA